MTRPTFCPHCHRKLYTDADGEKRCECRWHERCRLAMPNTATGLIAPPQTVKVDERMLVKPK